MKECVTLQNMVFVGFLALFSFLLELRIFSSCTSLFVSSKIALSVLMQLIAVLTGFSRGRGIYFKWKSWHSAGRVLSEFSQGKHRCFFIVIYPPGFRSNKV